MRAVPVRLGDRRTVSVACAGRKRLLARPRLKGGWGAGTGEVEHQVVLLRHGPVRVSAAVLITDSPSHAYAKQTLQGLFVRLLRGVGRLIVAPAPVAGPDS